MRWSCSSRTVAPCSYRGPVKGMHVLLSNSQSQVGISRSFVQAFSGFSVLHNITFLCIFLMCFLVGSALSMSKMVAHVTSHIADLHFRIVKLRSPNWELVTHAYSAHNSTPFVSGEEIAMLASRACLAWALLKQTWSSAIRTKNYRAPLEGGP